MNSSYKFGPNEAVIFTPKGLEISAQGCRLGLPWVRVRLPIHNPERVGQKTLYFFGIFVRPFQGRGFWGSIPQGGASACPGLCSQTPSG